MATGNGRIETKIDGIWETIERAKQRATRITKTVRRQLAVTDVTKSKKLRWSFCSNFDLENELKTTQSLAQKAVEYEIRVTQLTRQMLLWYVLLERTWDKECNIYDLYFREEDTAQLEEQNRYIKGLLSEWLSREELVRSLQSENSRLEQELRYAWRFPYASTNFEFKQVPF